MRRLVCQRVGWNTLLRRFEPSVLTMVPRRGSNLPVDKQVLIYFINYWGIEFGHSRFISNLLNHMECMFVECFRSPKVIGLYLLIDKIHSNFKRYHRKLLSTFIVNTNLLWQSKVVFLKHSLKQTRNVSRRFLTESFPS